MTTPVFINTEPWTEHAACKDTDYELWFPKAGDNGQRAKRICAGCPVRQQCLDFAITNEEYGIWGGMSEHQRREHIRATRPPRPETRTHCRNYHPLAIHGVNTRGNCRECSRQSRARSKANLRARKETQK